MHILAPHLSCVVNLPLSENEPNELEQAMAEGYAEIYVITAEGIIKHHKLRGNNRYVRVKVDRIPGFEAPKLPQAINFLPAGKIPKALFDQILGFFYAVMKANGEKALEAMAHILWNPEQGYHIGIPPQEISAASVRYDWSYVPVGTSIIVDIHSHNNMNAFFSGTDNADDRANISFSGVVGKLNETTPQTVWRFNYQDRKFEAKFEDIFDVEPAQVPDEWLQKVEISKPRVTYRSDGSFTVNKGSEMAKRGRADHLKQYQFKKKDEKNEVNGNRIGPHLRSSFRDRSVDEFGTPDFWGLVDQSVDDRSFAYVTEDPLARGGRLGKSVAEVGNVDEENDPVGSASADLLGAGMGHDRWDELSINHGQGVADAFCVIDTYMADLSEKDDLIQELMGDMLQLASEKGQFKIFRSLYELLSPRDQQQLATSGF